MIVSLSAKAGSAEVAAVRSVLESLSFISTEVKTQTGRYLVAIGSKEVDIRRIGCLSGVRDVHRVNDAFKLVSRTWKVHPTAIDLGDGVVIGEHSHTIMAGPCSIESEAQVESTVKFLVGQGVRVMRGGVFKPRSSPYTFRGLGLEGLKVFASVAHTHGVKLVTEVLDVSQIEPMYEYVDMFQVGARNSQNFTLLDALGKQDKPVLLKRGISGTLEELLQSAEYIFSQGNERILLCERGIRSFEKSYRNTLDLNAVPYLKEKSHLPVIVDPSHGIGVRRFVGAMALAGVAAGADGTIVEIHEKPECAMSDGAQTLNYDEASELFGKIEKIVRVLGEMN
jgi:3-deoxy-7-phosphoheptulonate synthase